jgi:hypothetical protein
MQNTGIPILDSLDILRHQPYTAYFRNLLHVVYADVKSGLLLSDALDKHKKVFPHFFRSMVRVGELSGKMDLVFASLADYYESDRAIKAKVKSALSYPMMLLGMTVGIVILMMLVVIPTFRDVLALVDGRVPILVELKGESFDTALCPKVAEILKSYTGDYCVESFNPLLIKDIQKYLPGVYCGLLYTNACKEKKKYSIINIAVSCMLLNFLAKPNFIAFNKNCRHSVFVKLTTGLYKAPKFVWTVKSEEEFNQAHSNGECAIFER